MDSERLARFAAFIATGLALVSFLILAVAWLAAFVAPPEARGDRIPLVFVLGTIAGLALAYARWEYRNLRLVRERPLD